MIRLFLRCFPKSSAHLCFCSFFDRDVARGNKNDPFAIPALRESQRRLIRNTKGLLDVVYSASNMALKACRESLKEHKWNCNGTPEQYLPARTDNPAEFLRRTSVDSLTKVSLSNTASNAENIFHGPSLLFVKNFRELRCAIFTQLLCMVLLK